MDGHAKNPNGYAVEGQYMYLEGCNCWRCAMQRMAVERDRNAYNEALDLNRQYVRSIMRIDQALYVNDITDDDVVIDAPSQPNPPAASTTPQPSTKQAHVLTDKDQQVHAAIDAIHAAKRDRHLRYWPK